MQAFDSWKCGFHQCRTHTLKSGIRLLPLSGQHSPKPPLNLHLSCFLPWDRYLSTHSGIMSAISHSITLHPGWQTHSQPSSMSGCTYSTCSAFYLLTDRPLTCENIFLHCTGFSEHRATKQPQYLIKLQCQQNILINYLGASVVITSDGNNGSPSTSWKPDLHGRFTIKELNLIRCNWTIYFGVLKSQSKPTRLTGLLH